MVNVSIQLEMLKQLLEEIKVLKADYVIIRYNGTGRYQAIGTDPAVIFIKYINLKLCYSELIVEGFNVKEMNTFMKAVGENDNIQLYGNSLVNTTKSISIKIFDYILDDTIYRSFNNTLSMTTPCAEAFIDLTDNDDFNTIISGKTADGCNMLNIKGYPISVYSSLLPINKDNKVELQIFDKDYHNPTFIAEFIISKKKDIKVYAFIRYLKV